MNGKEKPQAPAQWKKRQCRDIPLRAWGGKRRNLRENAASQNGDVVIRRVGHVVVALVPDNPSAI